MSKRSCNRRRAQYQAAIHWITYAHGVAWLLAAGIVRAVMPASWRGGFIMDAVTIVLWPAGVLSGAGRFNWWITEIAVTNRRVIYKRGFISRTTAEMHMDKSRASRSTSRSRPHLDYGNVTIVGTGSGEESLGTIDEPIATPLELRNHITGV